ncbi:MAG: 2Fe-2S iron-sulfur cluster binding domain-containing protein [Deferribacterales bacterium]
MFFNTKKCKVILKNHNITVEVKSGSNLYDILINNGIQVPTLCKGNGHCGKCRVRIISADKKPINKPTKKDTIILAPINIDAGFRLACQYEVKSDIVVDTSDFFKVTDKDSDIITVKKRSVTTKTEIVDENSKSDSANVHSEKIEIEQYNDAEDELFLKPQVIKISPKKKLEEFKEEIKSESVTKSVESTPEEAYESVNGTLLIQYPSGIKYYIYSPSIDNISSEGFIKTTDRLDHLFKEDHLNDFIFNSVKATDIERVIMISDTNSIQGDILLNLISYIKLDKDGIIYELLQPYNHPKNLLSFFRQITNIKNNTLTIPLDNFSDCYYNTNNMLIHLNGKYAVEDIRVNEFINAGRNPIVDIGADLSEVIVKDHLMPPDSMSFTVLLKLITVLKTLGIIDQHLNLKSRNELMDKLPLELLVKLSFRNDQKIFNLYRNKDVSIFISQLELDSINHLRIFIHTLCSFVESNCGKIENIHFHTLQQQETLVNELINLNIIPQKYAKKSKLLFGDPVVNCIKLFNYKDTPYFIKKNFGEEFSIFELYKNEEFNNIYKKYEKEFLSTNS